MDNKQRFKEWCVKHPEIALHLQYDWLQTIAKPEQWDVVIVTSGDEIQAFMPFFKKRKIGFDVITVPPLTPFLGPWIHYPEGQKECTRLSFEKKIFQKLIDQLPKVDRFIQYFHPRVTNWLPFYWNGFEQSTRYTYVINDLTDSNKLYDDLQGNIRREIAKAQKQLLVLEASEIDTLLTLKELDYAAKGQEMNFPNSIFKNIFQVFSKKGNCKVWIAYDKSGKPVASLLLIWDEESAYYIGGATSPENKNMGAMSLLIWTAILFSSSVTESFSFVGSMMEPIERFFRSFGAKQTPYFEIRKTDSKLLKLL